MRLRTRNRYVLTSPFSPAECAARLRDARAVRRYPLNLFVGPSDGSFDGWVSGDRFMLRRPPRFVRSSFAPIASGKLSPAGSGTRVDVWIGQHPLAMALLLVAGGCLTVYFGLRVTAPWIAALLTSPAATGVSLLMSYLALLPVLVPAILLLAYWQGSRQEGALLDALCRTLAATDVRAA